MEPVSMPSDDSTEPKARAHDVFDVYSVAISDTNELRSYGQRIDSVYVTILTLILGGDAYVAAASRFDSWVPVIVTAGIGLVGLNFCQRWLRGLKNHSIIVRYRYDWLRNLEATDELRRLHADLFTSEYQDVYEGGKEESKVERDARRRNRQIQRVFRMVFLAIPVLLALATFAATNPWLHLYIEPLTPGK